VSNRDTLFDLEPLPISELEQYGLYQWLEQEDARQHPIVMDVHGTLRFKPDPVVVWLHDRCMEGMYLNDLWLDYARGLLPLDAVARHYRDIGYSLGGYHEVISTAYDELSGVNEDDEDGEGEETNDLSAAEGQGAAS
jgi:hypothetical protein